MNNNRRITLDAGKNIVVEFTNERIIPASGLAVVGAIHDKSDFIKKTQPHGCHEESFTASDQKW